MTIKELNTIPEILNHLYMIQFLYPNMTLEKYESYINKMFPHNYKQIAVFDNDICLGITGYWENVKLWTGPYLEIDNFVVHPDYRKKGVGKLMTDFIDTKAKELGVNVIVLDAYVENFNAHKFYYNQGFIPRGYHFLKILKQEELSS